MATIYHPGLGTEVKYEVTQVPDSGDGQTEAVIELMTRYVEEDATSPRIKADASEALAQSPSLPAHEAVFWYVKRRMRFVRDEITTQPFAMMGRTSDPFVEALIRPVDMSVLKGLGQGDCDDFAMYTAALLTALGIKAKFVTVAANPLTRDYSHVYVAAYPGPGDRRVALDTSHGEYPGWETNKGSRVQEWAIGGGVSAVMVAVAVIAAIGVWLCR